ncbi:MAG TPA: Rieske 2Fe-2S domain-containing protein, partial [Thermoanaerobaculia bacterium]
VMEQSIANFIDEQQWLDALDPIQKGLREWLSKAKPVKNALHGVWLHHPLHPALVAIPIGAWTVAAVLDALEVRAADTVIGIGILGALASAVTGITDWSETDSRAKKIGAVHGSLNVVATALYTTSWIMRGNDERRRPAIALSMLGFAIANASAWLGGHLAFGEQVGVDHTATADATKPEKFTEVIDESELKEGKPVRVTADGVPVCLVKRGETIHAITDTCPHLGGPLSEGKLDGDVIQCPWHGSEFSLTDGRVVNGPATYDARPFDVRVRAGKVEVRAATTQGAS